MKTVFNPFTGQPDYVGEGGSGGGDVSQTGSVDAGNLALFSADKHVADAGVAVADLATAAQGAKADTALQSGDVGSAAFQDTTAFATAAQGATADTAIQPDDDAILNSVSGVAGSELDINGGAALPNSNGQNARVTGSSADGSATLGGNGYVAGGGNAAGDQGAAIVGYGAGNLGDKAGGGDALVRAGDAGTGTDNDGGDIRIFAGKKDGSGADGKLKFIDQNSDKAEVFDLHLLTADRTVTFPDSDITLGGGGATEFTELTDAPSTYVGQAGLLPRVNDAEDALEFTPTAPVIDYDPRVGAFASGTITVLDYAALQAVGASSSQTVTVADYTLLAGKTFTITDLNSVDHVFTEGVEWTAAISNNDTAASLAAACVTINGSTGIFTISSGAVVTVFGEPHSAEGDGILIATNEPTGLVLGGSTLTGGADGKEDGLRPAERDGAPVAPSH